MDLASSTMVTAGWVLILCYAAIILYFVVRGAGQTKEMDDYALGSVMFSPTAVGLSLAASITSAATFIINPGFVALYGFSGVIALGLALPLATLGSLILFTKGFRNYGTTVKALSMADWIRKKYKSRRFGIFFGFLSLLLITFIVLICVGLTKVLSSTLNLPELYVLTAIVVFIFGYMMFGGANSMVYTNTIQAILMVIVAFVLLGSGYEHFSNGVTGFLDTLNAIDPKLTQITNESSFLFRGYFEIFIAPFIVGIAIVCQPHILTKSLLLKREEDVNRYLLVGISAQFLFFLVVIAGLYARISFSDLTINGEPLAMDGIVSAYVVKEFTVAVALLIVMGLISAGISTLESLIQSLSTSITNDIIQPLTNDSFFENDLLGLPAKLVYNRLVIVLMGAVTIFLSWQQLVNPKLSVGIFAQNGVYAYFSAAFVPILLGTFFKEVPKLAPIAASVTAVIVHFTVYYAQLGVPFFKADGENPGVAASLAIISAVIVGFSIYAAKSKSIQLRSAKTEPTALK
ncbi:sodium/pantothenate symporter [Fodinibius halophilus]|uniref:Sodium:solute symporter n=1 Tax=Fodinibius halophilus TaxID=1736908 RepID=A0A6M1T604_9BACT|nr:sodium:solute symporter [Fodinibius halophilus]NGP89537.1 sodium:solute symporter [Fodinibius halophilus]